MKNAALSFLFGATLAVAQTPQHLTIVSIGDSYAAGEGNPNSVTSNGVVHWSNLPCHRSVNNGRRIASDRINNLDNVSTTFVDFSCSGAGIQTGLINGMTSSQAGAEGTQIASQLDSVAAWQAAHGDVRIDALIISIGGNDVGFGSVVETCMLPTDCTTDPVVTNAVHAVSATLPGRLSNLNQEIAQRLHNVARVYITAYSNPFHDEDGPFCGNFFEAITSSGDPLPIAMSGISAVESQFLEAHFLAPMNNTIANFAAAHNWKFISGVQDTFRPHGFCNGAGQRWINTLGDSLVRQHDIRGTAHPNLAGQRAYADSIVAQFTRDFNLQPEAPILTEIYERNDGIDLPDQVDLYIPGATLKVQAEVAQTADSVTVQLLHRVRNDIFETQVPAFTATTMNDAGAGQLNMFTAKISGVQVLQKIEYKVVVTGVRNGSTFTVSSPLETVVVGEALLN